MGNVESREGEEGAVGVAAVIVAAIVGVVIYRAWRLISSSQAQEEKPTTMGVSMAETTRPSQAAWSPPPRGWYKLNTDYSGNRQPHQGTPKHLGIGGLIRDHLGLMLCCFADRVPEADSIEGGEAFAILRGLEMARAKGFKRLIVESDHNSIVQVLNRGKLKNPKSGNENYHFYMDSIIRALDNGHGWFEAFEVHHVSGKANKCADCLAGIGAERGQCSMDGLREDIRLQRLLSEDMKTF